MPHTPSALATCLPVCPSLWATIRPGIPIFTLSSSTILQIYHVTNLRYSAAASLLIYPPTISLGPLYTDLPHSLYIHPLVHQIRYPLFLPMHYLYPPLCLSVYSLTYSSSHEPFLSTSFTCLPINSLHPVYLFTHPSIHPAFYSPTNNPNPPHHSFLLIHPSHHPLRYFPRPLILLSPSLLCSPTHPTNPFAPLHVSIPASCTPPAEKFIH